MFGKGLRGMSVALAITVFSATSYSWITDSEQNLAACYCPSQLEANNLNSLPAGSCQVKAANQSWLSWLTGKSRSSQFHYLDLLELLESDRTDSKANYSAHIR